MKMQQRGYPLFCQNLKKQIRIQPLGGHLCMKRVPPMKTLWGSYENPMSERYDSRRRQEQYRVEPNRWSNLE